MIFDDYFNQSPKKMVQSVRKRIQYLKLSRVEKIKKSIQMLLPQVGILYKEKPSLK